MSNYHSSAFPILLSGSPRPFECLPIGAPELLLKFLKWFALSFRQKVPGEKKGTAPDQGEEAEGGRLADEIVKDLKI